MHKELQRIRHGYYDLWFGTNAVYERWAKSHGLNNNLLLTLYLLKEFPNDCTQHLICEKLLMPTGFYKKWMILKNGRCVI